jgi:hypothetical protein
VPVSVFFVNAVLWPLAVLVGLPLALHLFARARPRVFDFSSVAFIQRALRFTRRVRKPREWLLLALRTAAAAAAVLVFLQPVLFSHRGGGPSGRRNVVVILDASASMGWSDGGQTRFAVACAEASEILAGLSSRDAADVVLAGAVPRAVFPEVGGNIAYLQEEVRRARLTSEVCEPEAAIRLAARLLDGVEGRREICVVSDFQRANWRGLKPRLPPGIGLTCVSVARGEAPNAALTRVEVDPPRPLPGEEATVLCEVANFSGAPQRRTVVLAADAARVSRDAVVPAWGRATVAFRQRIASAEPFSVSASLAEDAYPGDDRRWAAVEPAETLRIGVCAFGKGGAAAGVWLRGCRALGWARPEPLTPEAFGTGGADGDVVMLAGWDGAEPGRIRALLERGVPVVLQPAEGMPLARLATVLTGNGQNGQNGRDGQRVTSGDEEVRTVWEERPEGFGLKVAAPEHPVFKAFGEGEYGDPARGRVRGRLALPAARLPPGEALMAYADGVPALWLCRGARPLAVWNIPLDAGLSSVPGQGEFVPLLGELLLEMRRGLPDAARPASEAVPGQPLVWRPDVAVRAEDARLTGPDGREVPLRPAPDAHGALLSEPVARAGVYAWSVGGHERPLRREVVNFPAAESDLRALTSAEIAGLGALSAASGREVRDWQAGVPLWPRCLWAALALLLVEGAVAASDGLTARREEAA